MIKLRELATKYLVSLGFDNLDFSFGDEGEQSVTFEVLRSEQLEKNIKIPMGCVDPIQGIEMDITDINVGNNMSNDDDLSDDEMTYITFGYYVD